MKQRTSKADVKHSIPTLAPDIRLFGTVDKHMPGEFFRQQSEVKAKGPLVLELRSNSNATSRPVCHACLRIETYLRPNASPG